MIIRFLEQSTTFNAIFYNTDKVASGQAELMIAANFGVLDGLDEVRPMDYYHHLQAVTARNKRIRKPQLHVAFSTAGKSHDKHALTQIGRMWLEKMGYGNQPYLIFFHGDTDNNHIHIVSTRIDHEAKKIYSDFEWIRGLAAMNRIMASGWGNQVQADLEKAKSYRFTTIAQFRQLLEKQGYTFKDNLLFKFNAQQAEIDFSKLVFREADQHRAAQLKAIFKKYASQKSTAAFVEYLKSKMGIDLVFHSKDGKPPYGYTIFDHAEKNIYKGGQVMPLKELLNANETQQPGNNNYALQTATESRYDAIEPDLQLPINIASDIDDEAIHGPRRQRKKKTRTNLR